MQPTGLLHGARLLRHVDLPVTELLGPAAVLRWTDGALRRAEPPPPPRATPAAPVALRTFPS